MIEIKSCPFCGSSKLKVDSKRIESFCEKGIVFNEYSCSVRCNVCHARGGTVSKSLKAGTYPNQELKELAMEKWNNRI